MVLLHRNINALTYNRLLLSGSSAKAAAEAVTNNYFTLAGGTTFNAAPLHTPYSLTLSIAVRNFNAGTSTFTFTGSISLPLQVSLHFSILTLNKSLQSTLVNLNSDVNVSTVNMTVGTINTGSNLSNMTVVRSGPGIILGNVRRTQSFGLGGVYAFESPNTTLKSCRASTNRSHYCFCSH